MEQELELFHNLANKLGEIHNDLKNRNDHSDIEIEVRVGHLTTPDGVRATHGIPGEKSRSYSAQNVNFTSGVSPPDYNTIKDEIGRYYANFGGNKSDTQTSVYMYKEERVVFDDKGLTLPYKERKNKIKNTRMDLQIPSASYDLRVEASTEKRNNDHIGSEAPGGFYMVRKKRRISWKPKPPSKRNDLVWQVDLTLVDTNNKKKSWEVEFELLPSVRDEWLSMSRGGKEFRDKTSHIATDLRNLLIKINPMDPVVVKPTEETGHEIVRSVRQKMRQMIPGNRKDTLFPGAQPVNILRRNLPEIQSMEYFVAEKTDGVRYLMMALNKTCVLVDRSDKVFRLEGGRELVNLLGSGTILDGELVHDRAFNKTIFVAFDILQLKETDMTKIIFEKRREKLKERISHVNSHKKKHVTIMVKMFYPRKKIRQLFENVHVEGRHHIFKDKGGYLYHKMDGIILQPNLPYKYGTDKNLLKWKWAELASIDLKVNENGTKLDFFSVTRKGAVLSEVDLSKIVRLSVQDRSRLVADKRHADAVVRRDASRLSYHDKLEYLEENKHVYAEVVLDPGSGLWVYMGLRPDRKTPNFINVVVSTIVEIAEDLSEEELIYRMERGYSSDDWSMKNDTGLEIQNLKAEKNIAGLEIQNLKAEISSLKDTGKGEKNIAGLEIQNLKAEISSEKNITGLEIQNLKSEISSLKEQISQIPFNLPMIPRKFDDDETSDLGFDDDDDDDDDDNTSLDDLLLSFDDDDDPMIQRKTSDLGFDDDDDDDDDDNTSLDDFAAFNKEVKLLSFDDDDDDDDDDIGFDDDEIAELKLLSFDRI